MQAVNSRVDNANFTVLFDLHMCHAVKPWCLTFEAALFMQRSPVLLFIHVIHTHTHTRVTARQIQDGVTSKASLKLCVLWISAAAD